MKLRAALAIALFILTQPTWAQTSFGMPDCGEWINKPVPARKAWLLGYLSGINVAHFANNKTDPLEKINTAEQALLWVDNYCRSNPLSNVGSAALNLFVELVKK